MAPILFGCQAGDAYDVALQAGSPPRADHEVNSAAQLQDRPLPLRSRVGRAAVRSRP